ncbi:hypothetical protein [Granulicella tundricola]|uniref:Uncharacterized protein n=1 Tax=Granulicella tundricola (strain ATCC BAA-1859 / DSM 23138 / MP5ACTX9) TaxID=1198114 RepID=E8X7H7_GRATM|nr:hypothetical protein [Granulicella tundricola]ADW71411.1 hypothetical protein AciX9_4465 [Granulicella tundricola MP5ACTX9]
MQIFGRQVSNWWWFLVVPLLLVCIPFFLFLLIIAGHIGGAVFGPPALWAIPLHTPSRVDLVGSYFETNQGAAIQADTLNASLDLNLDGTMTVRALPEDSVTSTCVMSGTGRWKVLDGNIDLDYNSDGASGSCASGGYSLLEVAGHSKPYKLYWVLGDPDSGTGIWFKRR